MRGIFFPLKFHMVVNVPKRNGNSLAVETIIFLQRHCEEPDCAYICITIRIHNILWNYSNQLARSQQHYYCTRQKYSLH